MAIPKSPRIAAMANDMDVRQRKRVGGDRKWPAFPRPAGRQTSLTMAQRVKNDAGHVNERASKAPKVPAEVWGWPEIIFKYRREAQRNQ
jgi:hypothetical protein